jgi:SWI/SNF-related matrix-associated actin-dependent regulator of chromatin subfamily D
LFNFNFKNIHLFKLKKKASPAQSANTQMDAINRSAQLNRQQHPALAKKKGKLKDKIIPQKVRELVPDSQSYMDLLAFERKLDGTIMRKRLDIQEALKRPMKVKKKLRVFITNQMYPGKMDAENDEESIPQWELKIEGRLLDDTNKTESNSATSSNQQCALNKSKPRKFSSFFKSLVIELDKDLYGPDNHLVEWHRTPQTAETDGLFFNLIFSFLKNENNKFLIYIIH